MAPKFGAVVEVNTEEPWFLKTSTLENLNLFTFPHLNTVILSTISQTNFP